MKIQMKNILLLYLLLHLSACGVGSISTDLGVTDVEATVTDTDGTTAVITLSWTPPSTTTSYEPLYDLSGYKIYYGTSPDQLKFLSEVGANLTSIVLENDPRLLKGNIYYIGMSAFDSDDLEGPMSEIIMVDLTN